MHTFIILLFLIIDIFLHLGGSSTCARHLSRIFLGGQLSDKLWYSCIVIPTNYHEQKSKYTQPHNYASLEMQIKLIHSSQFP